jgi:hypothetical protein
VSGCQCPCLILDTCVKATLLLPLAMMPVLIDRSFVRQESGYKALIDSCRAEYQLSDDAYVDMDTDGDRNSDTITGVMSQNL